MIGHEAVGQDSHRLAQAGFGHQLDESVVVVGFMKHLSACVARQEVTVIERGQDPSSEFSRLSSLLGKLAMSPFRVHYSALVVITVPLGRIEP